MLVLFVAEVISELIIGYVLYGMDALDTFL